MEDHIWEDPSFQDTATFERDVKRYLERGDDVHGKVHGLKTLATEPNMPFRIEDAGKIESFNITRENPQSPGTVRYPKEINWIENFLEELFPHTIPEIVLYKSLPPGETPAIKPLDVILFEFDPEQATEKKRYERGGRTVECDVQMAAVRLFIMDKEYQPEYEDSW